MSLEDPELLKAYHSSFDDDKVDLDLVTSLLYKIHSTQEPGECRLGYIAWKESKACISTQAGEHS